MSTFYALQTRKEDSGQFATQVIERSTSDLPEGELLIEIQYSSLNYKDALSAMGKPGVTRNYPHTPGIDAVGIVKQSNDGGYHAGDSVIVTGYDLGMNTAGGLAQMIRVPASWVVDLPEGLSARDAMSLGTAGLTAGLCVNKLLKMGAVNSQGPILVTGATGGVGSLTVALLSLLGFEVVASTGKTELAPMLHELGAAEVIDRRSIDIQPAKPLLKPQWRHAVDCVGGQSLANILKLISPGGSVASCGLVGSAELSTTVLPFILRDINLLGVDSVEIPVDKKREIWHRFATYWRLPSLHKITTEITLSDTIEQFPRFLSGEIVGRLLVNVQ